MKEHLARLVEEYSVLNALTGYEQPVIRRLRDHLRPLSDEFQIGVNGNVYVKRRCAGEVCPKSASKCLPDGQVVQKESRWLKKGPPPIHIPCPTLSPPLILDGQYALT